MRRCIAQHPAPDIVAKNWASSSGFTLATLCSGTDGGISVAVEYIDKCLNGVGSPWVHLFSCDKDPQVQRWLVLHSKARHIFPDVTRLICEDGKQVDARSLNSVVVPGALIVIAGTSGKQFSALCNPGKRAKTLYATSLGRDRACSSTLRRPFQASSFSRTCRVLSLPTTTRERQFLTTCLPDCAYSGT